ncbi:MAG: glycoside hydrolase family 97 N-terminal domain-containing protein, partial [Phaeodactylibacter sp.]|nr:glycoside hydrolase family 97 N-terminal domain-containing protein [Phaeodactylibacter sp.]
MKKPVGFSLIFALFSLVACQTAPQQVRLENAAQTLQMHLELSAEGQPFYRLFYQDQLVLDTSFLGLVLENLDLSHTLRIGGVEGPVVVSDTYELQHGKQRQINYSAQAYTVTFQND